MWHMKTVGIPVVVVALSTVNKGMVENIKKVSERATMTEIQKICMLASARILREVLSVWTEWLTWVTDALGAWFAPGWCTKRTPAKTVIKEIIIIILYCYILLESNRKEGKGRLRDTGYLSLYQLRSLTYYTSTTWNCLLLLRTSWNDSWQSQRMEWKAPVWSGMRRSVQWYTWRGDKSSKEVEIWR